MYAFDRAHTLTIGLVSKSYFSFDLSHFLMLDRNARRDIRLRVMVSERRARSRYGLYTCAVVHTNKSAMRSKLNGGLN